MAKRWVAVILVGIIFLLGVFLYLVWQGRQTSTIVSPLGNVPTPRPLLKYSFNNLRQRKFEPSTIIYDNLYGIQNPKFATWTFHYFSDGKKVSGLANLPTSESTQSAKINVPIVVMLHGSADSFEEYFPGFGTQHVAAVLAENGMATFAPDYFGYGSSDKQSPDPFEDRFQTYTVTLTLLASLESNCKLVNEKCKLGLWGHSNGGQIALSDLEISGKNYPTVLWNPVSKSFPYNILYYTDTYDDQGKWLRGALAKFETLYNVRDFSTADYFPWIEAPILLQQGEMDELVPKKWSDELYQKLSEIKLSSPSTLLRVEYKVYSRADHNMVSSWNQAVTNTVSFYQKWLEERK